MYIKILVYIIDNQQVKYKISILFSACRSFAVLVSRPSWIVGGRGQKRQRGGADFGEVVRPAYPKQYPHASNNVQRPSPNIPHTSSQPTLQSHITYHLI